METRVVQTYNTLRNKFKNVINELKLIKAENEIEHTKSEGYKQIIIDLKRELIALSKRMGRLEQENAFLETKLNFTRSVFLKHIETQDQLIKHYENISMSQFGT